MDSQAWCSMLLPFICISLQNLSDSLMSLTIEMRNALAHKLLWEFWQACAGKIGGVVPGAVDGLLSIKVDKVDATVATPAARCRRWTANSMNCDQAMGASKCVDLLLIISYYFCLVLVLVPSKSSNFRGQDQSYSNVQNRTDIGINFPERLPFKQRVKEDCHLWLSDLPS